MDIIGTTDVGSLNCSIASGVAIVDTANSLSPIQNLADISSAGVLGVSWDAPASGTPISYDVEYIPSTGDNLIDIWPEFHGTASLNFSDPVYGGIDYDVRVRAVYSNGKSEWVYLVVSVAETYCSLPTTITVYNYL